VEQIFADTYAMASTKFPPWRRRPRLWVLAASRRQLPTRTGTAREPAAGTVAPRRIAARQFSFRFAPNLCSIMAVLNQRFCRARRRPIGNRHSQI
jgi:hypothetical protein